MKKRLISLLILTAVLVVLGGSALAMNEVSEITNKDFDLKMAEVAKQQIPFSAEQKLNLKKPVALPHKPDATMPDLSRPKVPQLDAPGLDTKSTTTVDSKENLSSRR